MNRHRLNPMAATLALAAMVQPIEPPTQRVKPLPNVPDHRPNSKQWSCKRCGEKFTPHRSPTYCDNCQSERMGERMGECPKHFTREDARDAIHLIVSRQIPVNPYVLRDLFQVAELEMPEKLKAITEQSVEKPR